MSVCTVSPQQLVTAKHMYIFYINTNDKMHTVHTKDLITSTTVLEVSVVAKQIDTVVTLISILTISLLKVQT